jgi:hypothetical protein
VEDHLCFGGRFEGPPELGEKISTGGRQVFSLWQEKASNPWTAIPEE